MRACSTSAKDATVQLVYVDGDGQEWPSDNLKQAGDWLNSADDWEYPTYGGATELWGFGPVLQNGVTPAQLLAGLRVRLAAENDGAVAASLQYDCVTLIMHWTNDGAGVDLAPCEALAQRQNFGAHGTYCTASILLTFDIKQ